MLYYCFWFSRRRPLSLDGPADEMVYSVGVALFVIVMVVIMVIIVWSSFALAAVEGQEQQTEGIERGHKHASEDSKISVARPWAGAVMHRLNNRIFAEKSRGARKSGQCQGADPGGNEGDECE